MPDTYTTTQGDCWDLIAFKLWGEEHLMDELLAANPDHRGTVIFSAGVELTVPDVDVPTVAVPLPPWRKS